MSSLYAQISKDFISKAIHEFYLRAFNDPIIGHFFFNSDHAALVVKQIDFTCRLFQGSFTKPQLQKMMRNVHKDFSINNAHFSRRQVLMRDILEELSLDKSLSEKWLELEEELRAIIVSKRS